MTADSSFRSARRPPPTVPTVLVAAVCCLVLGACSNQDEAPAGAQVAPDPTGVQNPTDVDFSLTHILARRVHRDMWMQSVYQALLMPTRPLDQTPPPPDPSISFVSVSGDVDAGFTWTLRALRSEDLAGVSRVISGDVTFTGDPLTMDEYTGTYTGTLLVQWFADPDGGRAEEAAMLNTEANRVVVTGNWKVTTFLQGMVSGTLHWARGDVTDVTEIE